VSPRALISIGTNSTRLLAADVSPSGYRILAARSIGTRIGEGLKENGSLGEAAVARTLDAVCEHVAAARSLDASIQCIATSAVRRARNAAEFAASVRRITGSDLHIVSGEDEARCAFRGATSGLAESGTYGVLDLGGGSTEYAVGPRDEAQVWKSLEIGAVRLTERYPELAGERGAIAERAIQCATAEALEALSPLADFPAIEHLIFVGGSATTAVSVLHGSREQFVQTGLRRDSLQTLTRQLQALPLEARRKLPGMNPQRADILLAGTLVLDAAFEKCCRSEALVSSNDLLLGYLLQNAHAA